MKSFKEYLLEVEWMPDYISRSNIVKDKVPELYGYEKVDTMPAGHHLITKTSTSISPLTKNSIKITHYAALNPETKKVDMHVSGILHNHENGTKTLKNPVLSGRPGSSLKAHEFYHHLITKHDVILHSSAQSEGGRKTWVKLSKMPDVHVHGFTDAKNVVRADPSKRHLYYKDTGEKDVNPKKAKHIAGLSVVAHKAMDQNMSESENYDFIGPKAEGHYKPISGKSRLYMGDRAHFTVGSVVKTPEIYKGVNTAVIKNAYYADKTNNDRVTYHMETKLPKGHPDAYDENGAPDHNKSFLMKDDEVSKHNPSHEWDGK